MLKSVNSWLRVLAVILYARDWSGGITAYINAGNGTISSRWPAATFGQWCGSAALTTTALVQVPYAGVITDGETFFAGSSAYEPQTQSWDSNGPPTTDGGHSCRGVFKCIGRFIGEGAQELSTDILNSGAVSGEYGQGGTYGSGQFIDGCTQSGCPGAYDSSSAIGNDPVEAVGSYFGNILAADAARPSAPVTFPNFIDTSNMVADTNPAVCGPNVACEAIVEGANIVQDVGAAIEEQAVVRTVSTYNMSGGSFGMTTNATTAEFSQTLQLNGYTLGTKAGNNGAVQLLSKGANMYKLYNRTSTGPGASFHINNSPPLLKFTLGQ